MRKGFTLIELMIVIAIIAIIAAIAIPNLLESRVTANEAAASTSLKSGVFPAQVQFQGGGYLDRDQDNVGEYGTLGMLAGKDGTPKIPAEQIRLLTGPLASEAIGQTPRAANGFNFVGVAPSATDAAQAPTGYLIEGVLGTALTAITAAGTSANEGERNFAVGCAPQRYSDTGRRVFLISHDGQVRSPALAANANVWYAVNPPVNGTVSTAGSILTGLGDAFNAGGAIAAGSTVSINSPVSTYPTYAR